jgi:hypothetical protein
MSEQEHGLFEILVTADGLWIEMKLQLIVLMLSQERSPLWWSFLFYDFKLFLLPIGYPIAIVTNSIINLAILPPLPTTD